MFITYTLSLSAAIMIGISITDLIPSSFFNIIYYKGVKVGQYLIFFIVIISYMLTSYLIKLTDKIKEEDLYKTGILCTFSLLAHNLPEGIAVFITSVQDNTLGIKLATSIIMHNIPEGLIIAIPIYYATKSRTKAIMMAAFAGLAEPLGALITYWFLQDIINMLFIDSILLFVGIMMVTLAIKEIFSKAESYNEQRSLIKGFITGLLIILLNIIFSIYISF